MGFSFEITLGENKMNDLKKLEKQYKKLGEEIQRMKDAQLVAFVVVDGVVTMTNNPAHFQREGYTIFSTRQGAEDDLKIERLLSKIRKIKASEVPDGNFYRVDITKGWGVLPRQVYTPMSVSPTFKSYDGVSRAIREISHDDWVFLLNNF